MKQESDPLRHPSETIQGYEALGINTLLDTRKVSYWPKLLSILSFSAFTQCFWKTILSEARTETRLLNVQRARSVTLVSKTALPTQWKQSR